jgi:hypothetical protein
MDGTAVLLYGEQEPFEALNARGTFAFSGYWDPIDGSWCSSGSTWLGPFYTASHWMPLPKPPADTTLSGPHGTEAAPQAPDALKPSTFNRVAPDREAHLSMAVEALETLRQDLDHDKIMRWWDRWRKLHTEGFAGSLARDEFETWTFSMEDTVLDALAKLQAPDVSPVLGGGGEEDLAARVTDSGAEDAPSTALGSNGTALIVMLSEAVRFAAWAAGEGICPVDGQPAKAPEDFLMAYSEATGEEEWETMADRLPGILALSGAQRSELSRSAPDEPLPTPPESEG